ncbi:BT4734/BF3469 family protein [Flagellimonas hadalis]|uniref:BT4734-like N-terminal domain-containing protein n=1 Tax=Flagellimonas hadalis TaxID=2597517 RepID=A0A5N5IQJ4_9FLAO|nr:BT4734/BF3469 family protein [Allomuricauda hadalis]KAB5484500.1 hypothetical protein FOT42_016655 [Allomuricauda hadalis]
MNVSKFDNIYSKRAIQSELMGELLDIKKGKYKNIIEKCRYFTSKNNYDSYNSLKIKLPLVTFCGTFVNGRKLEHLVQYNNLMILDVDHIEAKDIFKFKREIESDKYTFAVWLSPSGEGLKALVRIDSSPEEHRASFQAIKNYYKLNYNIELDNSGSDVTRLCFVSWDENLYHNNNSEVFTDKFNPIIERKNNRIKTTRKNVSLTKSAYATEGLNKREHRRIIGQIIKYLKRKELSITNTFDEWFRVAVAIAATFSYDLGEKYYLQLCELDKDKHDEIESKNILQYCYNNRKLDLPSTISFGTIIFYAKEKGFLTGKDKS